MILRLVLNKRLCYGYSTLPTLFDISPVVIALQRNFVTHSEAAAVGRFVEEHD